MNFRATIFHFLAITALFHLPALAGEWTQWRGPQRDGHSDEKNLLENWETAKPKLVWTKDGFGKGYASVTIADGTLYTTGNFSDGQAVVAAEVVWKKSLTSSPPKHGYDGSRCSPSIDGDRLYAVTSDGAIHCLKRDGGEVVWSKSFKAEWSGRMMSGWGYSESPLVDGDWVLCTPGGAEAMIVALDRATGKEVWKAAVPDFGTGKTRKGDPIRKGAGYSSIVVSEGAGVKQYVTLVGQGLIGVRASDGKFLWGYEDVANKTAIIPTAICEGDFVFGSSGYGTGAALLKLESDGQGGVNAKEQYFLDAKKLQNHHGGMVMVGDYIYCGHNHNSGFPICVEWKTGEVKWMDRGPGSGSAAVLFADGNLVYRYQNGTVALIEATPEKYNLKGTLEPDYQEGKTWAHPVIVDGKLYLREQDKLMCYDVSS